MKTKRRHELQTNQLADWLGTQIERIKPYSKLLTGGAILILLALLAFMWMRRTQLRQEGDAWRDYFLAGTSTESDTVKDLEKVASQYAGTEPGLWAVQSAADIELANGIQQLFRDRDLAETALNAAREQYRLVEKSTDDKLLRMRALFGLGQVAEALSQVDDAKAHYQQVAELDPDGALGKEAQERMNWLGEQSIEDWYVWFKTQKPLHPSAPGGLNDPLGGSGLGPLSDTPGSGFGGLGTGTGLPSATGTPPATTPSDGSTTPADGTTPTDGTDVPTGTEPTGTEPTGTPPTGTDPTGTEPTGTPPTGTPPTGTDPTGTEPTGTPPTGTDPTGTNPPSTDPSADKPATGPDGNGSTGSPPPAGTGNPGDSTPPDADPATGSDGSNGQPSDQ